MDLHGQWMKSTPQSVKDKVNADNGGDYGPSLHYNWSGWSFITNFLESHGLDMSTFSGDNSGDLIPRDICMQAADIIEKHIGELPQEDQDWLKPHIESWRWAKNYKQY